MIGISSRTIERWRSSDVLEDQRRGPKRRPANALSAEEEAQLITVLTSERFASLPPKQLVPQLADEGLYLASESTIYRLLKRHANTRKSSARRSHVTRASIAHNATRPNQVWSWDITWLPTDVTGHYVYLYMLLDVWSRRIVGWRVAEHENSELAAELVTRVCREQNINPRGLVLHSDNGSAMRGRTMLCALQWLGIVPSFSRPHVSDDNPYSEAVFRTLKYVPAYPKRFRDRDAAEAWVTRFVAWYNDEHRHSAIRFVTPNQRHSGAEAAILAARHQLYQNARAANPERWARSTRTWTSIEVVRLNPQKNAA